MFAKRFLQKATHPHHPQDDNKGNVKQEDVHLQLFRHLGVPNTASLLAVDPIQRLLAVATLDGRIKVFGGENIEGLLISPKQLPYKNLEFLQNQGYLVSVLNDNYIQVWNLESRSVACGQQWESNITAFSVISGSLFMLVGDEYGKLSVLKYAAEEEKLVDMPYCISPDIIEEKAGISFPNEQPIVGVLPQPSCFGDRLLIAYQYGIIILWDVIEAKVIAFKGDKDLLMKDHLSDSSRELDGDVHEDMNQKEISALCWASSVGSMLAVGYIDGDILLWNFPSRTSSKHKITEVSSNDVVKLQLSTAKKRLPVITLHWCESNASQKGCHGQLFVYGGCEIGSEEVITVVSLEWFPGTETLKSVRRVDLALNGAFSDMVFLSSLERASKSHENGLFVLTRPGKLLFYDMESLSSLASQQDRKSYAPGVEFQVVVPTSDPQMTAAKLIIQSYDGKCSMWLSEMASIAPTSSLSERVKWPLTGGLLSEISLAKEKPQKDIYISGHQDGSVRIWDATYPIFSLVSTLEGQVHGIENIGSNTSVTKLDFCESVMNLAVGSECGVVRVYSLNNDAEESKLHWVKRSEREVYDRTPSNKGPQCKAVFSLVDSPVGSLQFSASGAKLAVGFGSGHAAVLDMLSLSVLFLIDSVARSMSPVISVILKPLSNALDFSKASKPSGPKDIEQTTEELMITLTQDAKVNLLNSKTGKTIAARPLNLKKEHTAISMYVLDGSHLGSASPSGQSDGSSKEVAAPDESKQELSPKVVGLRSSEPLFINGERVQDSLFLLCCQKVLRLYNMKSVIQGDDKPICKVKLTENCCWTSILNDIDEMGLMLIYQSGKTELRSLPSLELLTESSLASALRWTFRPKMEKLASCTDSGHICLVNGSELAFLLFNIENRTRLLESLPLFHDKVLAAAADAAISHSLKQKKQVSGVGVLGDIAKGFKKEKLHNGNDTSLLSKFLALEKIFSQPVVSDLSVNTIESQEEEKEEELDIDDIEIDEPVLADSSSSHQAKGETTKSDRERLFGSIPMDAKPRSRTPEEIMAAYRGTEYASAAAERARNKLLERQEKLERVNQRSEDLRHEAEDFASMANELVKTMERKKWWKI